MTQNAGKKTPGGDPSNGPSEEAEDLYAGYLARQERGEEVCLDALCRANPRLESELRRVHREMECVAAADGQLHFIPGGGHSGDEALFETNTILDLEEGLLEGDGKDAVSEILDRMAEEAPGRWPFEDPEELGRGGFGIVYSVNEGALRRRVALKTLRNWPKGKKLSKRERSQHDRRLSRFLAEAQILAQLDHPSIVPFYGAGVDSSRKPYFTMRMVRGRDLTQVVKLIHEEREGWDVSRGLEVMLKVCDAVSYAHSKHVLHRDLKSDNIRVGRFGEVYVMDWGLARVASDDGFDTPSSGLSESSGFATGLKESFDVDVLINSKVTMDGAIVGSPAYMSPEQARGEHALVDSRSDIFSIGAILYHLFAGYPPYSQPNSKSGPFQIVMQVIAGPPTPLLEVQPNLAPELGAICEKAMARDPKDRYQSVTRLASDLRAFLDGRVVLAYGSGRLLELRKLISRNKALAWTTISAVLVIVLGLSLAALILKAKNTEISASEARLRSSDSFFDSTFLDTSLFDVDESRDRELNRGALTTVVDAIENARNNGLDEGLDPALRAKMAIAVGTGRMGQGKLNMARNEFNEALRLLAELDSPLPDQELRGEMGLLWVDAWDRRFSAGREQGAKVFGLVGPKSVERVSALMALSIVEHNAGRLEQGLSLIDRAIRLAQEINGATPRGVVGSNQSDSPRVNENVLKAQRANILTRLGAYRGDMKLIEEAKAIATFAANQEGRFEAALARIMLARIALKMGELEDANFQIEKALSVFDTFSGENSIHALNFRAVEADVQIARGLKDKSEAGAELVEQGLESHRRMVQEARLSKNFSHLTGVIRAQGRLAEALALVGGEEHRKETRTAFQDWYELLNLGNPELGVGHLKTLGSWHRFLLSGEPTAEDLDLAETLVVRARNISSSLTFQEQHAPSDEKPAFAWNPDRLILMELGIARKKGDTTRLEGLLGKLNMALEQHPDRNLSRDLKALLEE